MTDNLTSLVAAAQGGDLEAFGQVVERFQRMAHTVAYAMLGDAHLAEDAAQEAFIEAFLCLPKLREPAAFPGWFRRIVVKRGDRLIRGKRLPTVPIDSAGALPSGAPDLAALAEAHELRRQLHAALNTLPEADRQLVLLFYLDGYAQQEIAAIVELPVAAVKKRLYHARRRLRAQLDGLVREQLPAADQFTRMVQFFIAVRIGDVPKVRAYLDDDPALLDTHERWDETTARQHGLPLVSQFTALHRAAFNGDTALAEDFCARGRETLLVLNATLASAEALPQLLAHGRGDTHAALTLLLWLREASESQAAASALDSLSEHCDANIFFSRALAKQSIWPAIDPLASTSRLLDERVVGAEHVRVAREAQALLRDYGDIEDTGVAGDDPQLRGRARKALLFQGQPFVVAETFTGVPGEYVSAEEAVRGFGAIVAGRHDDTPEEAFHFTGTLSQALARAAG